MSDYYGLYGQKVQYLASDPTDVQIGQVWYNSTSATLKVRAVTTTGTWASGGNYPINVSSLAAAGIQTAAVAFGGITTVNVGTTASYNGTSWTANPTGLGTARRALAGFGTLTAAIAAGGYSTGAEAVVESWNGSSWSPVTSLNTSGYYATGVGIQTAGIVFGRAPATGATESWNGSSWTTVNSMVTTRTQLGAFGIKTAAIACGGANPGTNLTTTESWNGTSWTSVNSLNTGRSDLSGSGIQTAGLAFGGTTGSPSTATELWNGTSWTSNPTGLNTGRYEIGGSSAAGTQTAGLAVAGNVNPGNISNATEEWTGPGAGSTKTVTVS